jgi:hypothetical protein
MGILRQAFTKAYDTIGTAPSSLRVSISEVSVFA